MAKVIEVDVGDGLGNIFGSFKTVKKQGWAVVEEGEYNEGGRGPCQVVKGIFESEEEAKAVLKGFVEGTHRFKG